MKLTVNGISTFGVFLTCHEIPTLTFRMEYKDYAPSRMKADQAVFVGQVLDAVVLEQLPVLSGATDAIDPNGEICIRVVPMNYEHLIVRKVVGRLLNESLLVP